MVVAAKCIMDAWDSIACLSYKPGQGSLPGGLYEIDRDGSLAKLKTPRGNYVFEFDRNANPDDKPHDYSCKKPGCESLKPFKSLAELGTHANSFHKEESVAAEPDGESEDEEDDLSDRTCTQCDPHKVLKTPHGLRLHTLKSHPTEEAAVEQAA